MAATIQYAAIDVGSYEVEMAVYEISSKRGVKRIDHVRKILSLGRESYRTGRISLKTCEELCEVINGFLQLMKDYNVTAYDAYATSAIREAQNRQMVLDRIKISTGVTVKVLSNSEQRFLYYKALAGRGDNRFETLIQNGTAIIDIGFGSLQISLFDQGVLVTTQNIRLGALRLREMLSDVEGDSRVLNSLIQELVENEIHTFNHIFLEDLKVVNIIGVGNNILHSVHKALGYVEEGEMISAENFTRFYENMMYMSPEALSHNLQIPADYATLLIPGTMVYQRVLDITDATSIWAPDVCLCDGAAADFASSKKYITLSHDFTNDIVQNAYVVSRRYQENEAHARLIDQVCCELYDSLKKMHGMGKRERLLLRISAILHDCGKYVSLSASGDCAYHIVMSTEIIGLSHREREIVANVIRYNTMDFELDTRIPGTLTEDDFRIVAKLVAILRVANATDRSHRQKCSDISVRMKDTELQIVMNTTEDITLEKGLFTPKADFFEEVYGIRPVLKKRVQM